MKKETKLTKLSFKRYYSHNYSFQFTFIAIKMEATPQAATNTPQAMASCRGSVKPKHKIPTLND